MKPEATSDSPRQCVAFPRVRCSLRQWLHRFDVLTFFAVGVSLKIGVELVTSRGRRMYRETRDIFWNKPFELLGQASPLPHSSACDKPG